MCDVVNCASCHGDTTQVTANMAGADVPSSGGHTSDIPPGKFRARNITPDPETGIGRFSDGAVARALRHGVGSDGWALLPFMELQGLSDEDLLAVVSYLRSQPPVHNLVPAQEPNLLGRIVKATILADPVGPRETPPNITRGPTTGRLGHMSADDFVARFRAGRLIEGSPVPWHGFQRMSDDDLRAMHLSLMSLPPVTRDVGPPVANAK